MVFVAMTSDNLVRRTADYSADHGITRAGTPSSPSMNSRNREQLTLLESLHDPVISEAARRRNGEDIPPYARRMTSREHRFPTTTTEDETSENCDPPLDYDNSQGSYVGVTTSAPAPNALSDSDDDWSESEEIPAYLGDRLRQEGRWPPTTEEDGAFQERVIREWHEARQQARNGPRTGLRRRRSSTRAAREDSTLTLGRSRPTASHDEMLVPNARFRMRDRSHKISIVFDPPL